MAYTLRPLRGALDHVTLTTAIRENEALGDDGWICWSFSNHDVERAVTLYRERYDAVGWTEHRVYDGIGEAVATLHAAGHRLAVVTAKNEPHARRIVSTRATRLTERIDAALGALGATGILPEPVAKALLAEARQPE